MTPILEITDGTTTVSLINGNPFFLNDWTPNTAEPKAGGYYKDSPISDGKKLASYHWDNVIETFELKGGNSSQDAMIEATQDLRRLLVKAKDYWTSDWQDEPVYIKAKADNETNARYALIQHGRLQSDDNYYAQPFLQPHCRAVMDELLLLVERGHWLGEIPGDNECQEMSSIQSWSPYDWAVNDANPVGTVYDIFQTSAGTLLAADTSQLWRSTTGAVGSWSARTFGGGHWDNDPGIVYCFCESPNYVWAAAANGVFRSSDDGLNWVRTSAAMNAATANCLIWHSSGCLVFAEYGTAFYYGTDGEAGATFNAWVIDSKGRCCYEVTGGTANGYVLFGRDASVSASSVVLIDSPIPGSGYPVYCWDVSDSDDVFCFYEATDSSGNDFVYAGGDGCIFRAQASVSQLVSGWQIHASSFTADVYDFTRDGNGIYYASDSDNVWQSYDMLTWVSNSTGSASQFYTILYSTTGGSVYAGEAGDIWWLPLAVDMGQEDTCDNEVYFRNGYSVAQVTDVYRDDNGVYTHLFPDSSLPYSLFPAVPVANEDAIMFCVSNAVFSHGPFNNLVFDIGTAADGLSISWQYLDTVGPTWQTIAATDLQDNTALVGVGGAITVFGRTGVNSVHWNPNQSNWGEATPGGGLATGYWVRARVTAAATPTVPTQQNRDVYTVNTPSLTIDDGDVLGDIEALLTIKAENVADGEYSSRSPINVSTGARIYPGEVNRIVCGLRRTSRGSQFQAYLNISDEQWPLGYSVAAGTATTAAADLSTPTGRRYTYNPTGLEDMADRVIISLTSELAQGYHGIYHCFLRCREYDASNDPGNIGVRIQIRGGSGGITYTTDTLYCPTVNNWQLLDFGQINLPSASIMTSENVDDELEIAVQCSAASTNTDLYLYDVVLIPTDEWAGDFRNESGIYGSFLDDMVAVELDSTKNPKIDTRALAVRAADGLVSSIYVSDTSGPISLHPNEDQKLWFLTASNYISTGEDDSAVDNKAYVDDSGGDFLREGIEPSMIVVNATDGSSGIISTVAADRLDAELHGGTDNDFDDGDYVYVVVTGSWVAYPQNAFRCQAWHNERYLAARGSR